MLGVLVLGCFQGAGAAEAMRIDIGVQREHAGDLVALVSQVLEAEILLADDLLDAGASDWPLDCHLVDADVESALTAIAHSLECWWVRDREGRYLLTRERVLPPADASRVITYTSHLHDRRPLARQVEELLAPWLGGDHGLAYHADHGNWIATLDRSGHRHLEDLLTTIERGGIRIPPLVPPAPIQQRRDLRRAEAVTCADPYRLALTLRELCGHSVAVAAPGDLDLNRPLRLITGSAADLAEQLREQGLGARVIRGVLCVSAGDQPVVDSEHPARRIRTAALPVGHLGDAAEVAALIAEWTDPATDGWWRQPGAGAIHLPDDGLLVVRVDDGALRRLLTRHEAAERGDRASE